MKDTAIDSYKKYPPPPKFIDTVKFMPLEIE